MCFVWGNNTEIICLSILTLISIKVFQFFHLLLYGWFHILVLYFSSAFRHYYILEPHGCVWVCGTPDELTVLKILHCCSKVAQRKYFYPHYHSFWTIFYLCLYSQFTPCFFENKYGLYHYFCKKTFFIWLHSLCKISYKNLD